MVHIAKFDRDTVVRSAMQLFWQKGFGGTSTRDLQQAVNLHPGSIYATFGSKAGLYREALDCYADSMASMLSANIELKGSFVEGFKAFVRDVLFDPQGCAPTEMCMLLKSRIELDGKNAELHEHARLLIEKTEKLFAGLISDACKRGELVATTPATELAQYLQIELMGLRSYKACAGSTTTINAAIERLFVDYET